MNNNLKFEVQRPLDFLNECKGKFVKVETKDMKTIEGILIAFDIYINLVLDNAVEIISKQFEDSKSFGFTFIKGDNVASIHLK